MPPVFAPDTDAARPLHILRVEDWSRWRAGQDGAIQRWLEDAGFDAALGALRLLPGADGAVIGAVFGLGTTDARGRGRFHVAAAVKGLPAGNWRLEGELSQQEREEAALGWLLAGYGFKRYRRAEDDKGATALLVPPEGVDTIRIEAMAAGEFLTRDLINTPAADMGPADLEAAARTLAQAHGARIEVIRGDALLAANLPLIHAVGRAAHDSRAPRLIDLRWGDAGPQLVLVGKGVCFDTGGLNIKPGSSMGLMKKDMGGAATVLGLARMIMALGWPVRLRVLIPAVENAISGEAFRPGDILTARNGMTVEVNNTDAEGRLVLADALALAVEEGADALISMATLTGAARVAVGPDLAPFYCDDEAMAQALAQAGAQMADPVWRMPFWPAYEDMIEPGIADLDNAPSGGMAGSITAALFLRRFAGAARYVHFDIYGWQPKAAPARPKGGVGQGARALLGALPDLLGLW
jgi:leucyl aminopeptidase